MEYSLKLLPTACSTPIVPHAFQMVCRVYHTCYIPKKHDVILIARTRVKNRLSPRSASFAANKVKRRAASALFVATVDLTLAHAADTLRASAASSALARASRTNIAGTRVSDRGSMARCEGEVGAGGDDDVMLTLADKSPDDSEVRRRVEERGSVV